MGESLRDQPAYVRYLRESILARGPEHPPAPFRARLDQGADVLPFVDELEASLEEGEHAVWNVVGPAGMGKTLLARWVAARWARRVLERSRDAPGVLWLERGRLRAALEDDRAATGGPFGFALATAIPGLAPLELARLLARQRFVVILDKDGGRELESWELRLPLGLPANLGVLHLSLSSTLGGPTARLEPWDHETAVLAAHSTSGEEGVRRLEALESSPLHPLACYPLFLGWLWSEPSLGVSEIEDGNVGFRFLDALRRDDLPSMGESLSPWAAKVLECRGRAVIADPIALPARRLHVTAVGSEVPALRRVFEALLILAALEECEAEPLLSKGLLEEEVLDLVTQLPFSREVLLRLERCKPQGDFAASNLLSLASRLRAGPPSERHWSRRMVGVDLRGQDLTRGIPSGTQVVESNLAGVELSGQALRLVILEDTDLHDADLSRTKLRDCSLVRCRLDLMDLSEAELIDCELRSLDMTEAILGNAMFKGCHIESVVFGTVDEDRPVRFISSRLQLAHIEALAPAGLYLEGSKLHEVRLEHLVAKTFHAEDALFQRTSFVGFECAEARLRKARFEHCLLSDVSLVGADLRGATFQHVDFQPGPSSRSGHTDLDTRDDPLHGSKSGFYAEDSIENIYLDPDAVRTADLRKADLRGAIFRDTSLFRVDLRGAKIDPALRAAASAMKAFVD